MMHKTLTKLVFIILLTVIGPKTMFAQKEFTYHFDTFKTIQSPVFYDKVRVIDKRAEKGNIGYLRKEGFVSGKKIGLNTPEGLESSLQQYITRLISGTGKRDNELLLIVYDFKAEDAPILNECASLYIRMDAFCGTNGHYKFITTVDSFYEEVTGNATRVVRPLISNKAFNIISYLLSRNPDNSKGETVFTLESAQERVAGFKSKAPIYSQTPKDGLYKGYEQFLNNIPDQTQIVFEKVIITESLTHYYAYTKKDNGKKGERLDAKDYFTAHYNGNWYISDGKKFNKMVLENGDFYTDARMKGSYNHTAGMAMAFGLVGVLIAQGMNDEAWGTYKARLDMEYGKLMPVKRIR